MSIVIFSGTTEGRELSQFLSENKIEHIVCVATESGENVMELNEFARVVVGRMSKERMLSFLMEENAQMVIDATHPYASDVTKNLHEVCMALSLRYLRVSRDNESIYSGDATYYSNTAECMQGLQNTEGNILLTTGSKEIGSYAADENLRDRLYVRILPSMEAFSLCRESSVDERHIIAMYGPHTLEMNMAVIKQYDIKHVVTKQSGAIGGYDEKCQAAARCGARLHIITRPEDVPGVSLEQCKMLLVDKTSKKANVSLVGIGTGSEESLTIGAKRAIDNADIICGAKRMIEQYEAKTACYPVYLAEDVKRVISETLENANKSEINVAILFSGDTGVFSGAEKMYKELADWDKCSINVIPGISSFSAFAARLGESYTYSSLESLHGKSEDCSNRERITEKMRENNSVFVLMSGKKDFEVLSDLIPEEMMDEISIDVGFNISYPDEKIVSTDARGMTSAIEEMDEGLFIVRIKKRNS